MGVSRLRAAHNYEFHYHFLENYFMKSIFHTTHHIKVSDNVLSFDLKKRNLGVCVNHQIIMKVQIADLVFVSSELRQEETMSILEP